MRFDPLAVIEAGYAWHDGADAWLTGIARAMRPLEQGLGVYARIVDLSRPDAARVEEGVWEGQRIGDQGETMNGIAESPPEVLRVLYARDTPVAYARDRIHLLAPTLRARWTEHVARFGIRDVLGLFAHDLDGKCLHVGVPLPTERRLPARTAARLARIAEHLTSALRLRRLCAKPPPSPGTDAVPTPLGAAGDAREGTVRERLAWTVRASAQASGPLRQRDADEALSIWRGLADGSWSVIDHWDADGRRFVVARRSAPRTSDPKALTPGQAAVTAFLAMGHPEKYVAHLLGLSPGTIAAQFATVRRKLGVRTREELIALFSSARPLCGTTELASCVAPPPPRHRPHRSRMSSDTPKRERAADPPRVPQETSAGAALVPVPGERGALRP